MTTSLYTDTTIPAGQTVTVTPSTTQDAGHGAYALDAALVLTVLGSIVDQDSLPGDHFFSGIDLLSPGADLHIGAGGSISLSTSGAGGQDIGIFASAANTSIENDGSLSVQSDTGMFAVAMYFGGSFSNTGAITVSRSSGYGAGLIATGPVTIFNSGSVTIDQGDDFDLQGGGSLTNTGQITATNTAPTQSTSGISLSTPAGQVMSITNSGTITGTFSIVAHGSGRTLVTNTGTLNGELAIGYLQGGNEIHNTGAINGIIVDNASSGTELYDGRGGTHTGDLWFVGAGGIDIAYLGNGGETVAVVGGAGVLIALGGTGNDSITGGPANDVIDGGGGDNFLLGNGGADTFIVEPTAGTTYINDFSDDQGDRIDLAPFVGLHTLADVLAQATQSGPNTVISFGGGSTITLSNVTKANLTASDFILANRGQDFNVDGLGDLLWRNDSGDIAIWAAHAGAGGSVYFTGQDLGVVAAGWQIQGVGDFNGDGLSDILWRYSDGEMGVWAGRVGGSGAAFAGVDLGPLQAAWHVQAIGDVNGDGRADIVWRNDNGDVALWLGQAGPMPSFAGQDLGVVATSWRIDGIGDFNGDGRGDILWHNDNGHVAIWTSQANGTFAGVDLGAVPGWAVQGIGDFNGDGKADILLRNTYSGDVGIWSSQSSGPTPAFAGVGLGTVPSSWHFQDIVDVNGDGRADILWRNDNGDLGLWLANAGPTPSFAGLDLGVVNSSWHLQSQWLA
jgi:hypothetical protein